VKKRLAVCLVLGFCLACSADLPAAEEIKNVTHVTVRHEAGRCFGWPANGGIWSWGNEILVMYKNGEFQDKRIGSHDINYNKPIVWDQSRSQDGGRTWTHESTDIGMTEPMGAMKVSTELTCLSSGTLQPVRAAAKLRGPRCQSAGVCFA
jgi:hypothetical protein